jgi:hypothetical protein
MYPSTVCFSKYGRNAANTDKEMANTITPLKRHDGLVYCNIRLNNRVSNVAFIFFKLNLVQFSELNPAAFIIILTAEPASRISIAIRAMDVFILSPWC